jgi:excisionase family DNA binding protein
MTDRLLNAKEVADRLGVPESWVRQETRAGRMPHVRLGRYRRYDWDEVVAWLETQRQGQWRRHRPSIAPQEMG